jgi:hypothetical protein
MADANIRLGRLQYRTFAEVAKANGCVLGLSTVEEMKCFGLYSFMATGVVQNATDPHSRLSEHAAITLARSIDADQFRSASRPELDWGNLEDHEIFPFLFWHEIGHLVDNFDALSVATMEDLEARATCIRYATMVNEVLADRYAWNKIRPGEPIPVCDAGKRLQGRVATGLECLRKHAVHKSTYTRQPLPAGQYRSVPKEMLRETWKVRYVGARVADVWQEAKPQHYPSSRATVWG